MTNKRICIITPGNISSNPRTVKEADTLSEAGYDVKVICGDTAVNAKELDKTVLDNARWNYIKVTPGGYYSYYINRLKHKAAKMMSSVKSLDFMLAAWQLSPLIKALETAVLSEKSDLYIAHYLPALVVAEKAAKKYESKLAFDAEDFHSGELNNSSENINGIRVRNYIESTLIPKCDYLTGASPLISEMYERIYNVRVQTILNVFPNSYKPEYRSFEKNKESFSMYWFSQTIGPGRGLEQIVNIVSLMSNPVSLYLRGSKRVHPEFIKKLEKLAIDCGLTGKLHLLDSSSPGEMCRLCSKYDLGLSLELNKPLNRDICLTNKIFTYLLSGVPVVLSTTSAHANIAKELGEASVLIDIENYRESADILDKFLDNKQLMNSAVEKSRELSETRYNWDIEKEKLINIVENIL